jgi:hypothetical protein
MPSTIGTILDFTIIGLLLATIFFAMRLSKSLNNFRGNRDQLSKMIQDLNQIMSQASASTLRLKDSIGNSEDQLRGMLSKASGLSEELQFMMSAADKMADRLEKLVDQGRGHNAPIEEKNSIVDSTPRPAQEKMDQTHYASKAEAELAKALKSRKVPSSKKDQIF